MTEWIIMSAGVSKKAMLAMQEKEKARLPGLLVCDSEEIDYVVQAGMPPLLFYMGKSIDPPDIYLLLGDYDEKMDALAKQLDALGSVAYNSIEGKRVAMSKMATAQALAKAGVPIARTMPLLAGTTKEVLIAQFGLPMVVKPDTGFGGKGVRLVNSEEELDEVLREAPGAGQLMVAQEYISTSRGTDVRVMMVNHEAVLAVQRHAGDPGEFRSNVKVGGSVTDYEITPEMRTLCSAASRAVGLDFCGLDLLFTENGFLIGEVNSTPGQQAWQGKFDMNALLLKEAKRKLAEAGKL